MSKFVERLSAPSKSNKCYYSDNIFYKSGYGMPNCTCYAWGRWYELLGSKPKLYTGNAKTWFPKGESYDGYKRGQTPKLGAVCCWDNGGAGHVAIVEQINADGSILTSNSAWKSTNFYTKKIAKGYSFGKYKFQGFIYLPIDFDVKPTPTPEPTPFDGVSDEELAKRVWAGEFGSGEDRKKALGSRYNAVQDLVNKGVGKPAPAPTPEPVVETLKVGDVVVPIKLVDYKGRNLKQYDNQYVITQIDSRGAVLNAIRGSQRPIWAVLPLDNIKKV